MNNMYDILNTMKLLEGKGNKPDFLDVDKDGNKEEPFKKAVKDAEKKVAEDFGTTAAVVGGAALGAKLGKTAGIYKDAKEKEQAGLAKPRGTWERVKGSWKGISHPEYDDQGEVHKINPKYQFEDEVEESTGGYSAKAARAGKDIGKPGKAFAKIAKDAGERYGSKERGEKVAGAVLAKLRAKESIEEGDMEEGNDFTGARLAAIKAGKPTFKLNGKTYKVSGDTSDEQHMEESYDDLDIGQRRRTGSGEIERTKTGVIHRAKQRYGGDDEGEEGGDDDYDEWGNFKGKKKASTDGGPKKRGRPAGSKRAIGAKGPTGKSKLLKKDAIREDEFNIEEAIARLQEAGYTVSEKAPPGAKAERMVKHIKQGYAKDGKLTDKEKSIAYATAWKAKKAGKVEEEGEDKVEETTVAGSVATSTAAPAKDPGAPKAEKPSKGGMQFGKGVYEAKLAESFDKKLSSVLTEGVSINLSQSEDGKKTLNVSATDEDAVKLSQILHLAGMPQGQGYDEVCPHCGSSECGCEGVAEGEYSNSPEQEYSDTDTMVNTLSGGLNGRKESGQTTIPVVNRDPARGSIGPVAEQVKEDTESRLWDLYKNYSTK